jgi:hypothetical protein
VAGRRAWRYVSSRDMPKSRIDDLNPEQLPPIRPENVR